MKSAVAIRLVDPHPPWLGLRRRHLVELEDLPWFPAPWRDAGTSFLALALHLSGHAEVVATRLEAFLARTFERRILDLGSGGGGPMETVVRAASALIVHLTDLHPNAAALAAVAAGSGGRITFDPEPVDATRVPPRAMGLRTMINAFHHLPPEAARRVLQDAVDAGRPLAVIEVVSRSPAMLVAVLAAPLTFALTLPLQRPFRPANVFWTFVVPVLPAFVLWDGVVSWARIYHPDELVELIRALRGTDGWTFELGSFPLGGPARGVYLEASPPAAGER
jgi:hypothetical protein